MSPPLRLVVFDATQMRRPPRWLGRAWHVGSTLYRLQGAVDRSFGARSFESAFAWLERVRGSVAELQFWGHGKWGRALIDRQPWDRTALGDGHPLRRGLDVLRERLTPDALIWFRTCETLGALPGQDFAKALGDFTGARIAGHTYEIGFFQSGLRALAPGQTPSWDPNEGLAEGDPANPLRSLPSRADAPSTVTCLTTRLPAGV
jgi:hypothetical protein